MKGIEILYLNKQHKEIVEAHIRNIKRLMYFTTEDEDTGKYQDYLEVLNSIYLYSNNFYHTMIDRKNTDNGVVAEFMFLIPNMCFYSAIGFLTALKNKDNFYDISSSLEEVAMICENATSELADILMDETERKNIIKELSEIKINQN
tara:strand:+ start:309 stop:749 length:441 start_codon:yes stop_codon:yes gene_type:complete